jgi:L-fucose isomerase-like protein
MGRLKLKVQPLKLKSGLDFWSTEDTLLARDAWVMGPKKPRDVLRSEEVPPHDMSLQALEREGMLELLETITVERGEDIDKVPQNADLIIVGDTEDWFANDSILEKIASLGKPIVAEWDSWGYSIHGRISKFMLKKHSKAKRYFTMGADDLLNLLRAVRGWKSIRTMRILYIGRMPSHSVVLGDEINFEYLSKRFGVEFTQLNFDEYTRAIESVGDDVEGIVEDWKRRFVLMDDRNRKLGFYARIYKALRNLLNQHGANALTIDCAALPSIEYVPCQAYSLLIDEGIPCGCEADLPALFTMGALMGASGGSAMIGNLNENVTHADIEQDIVVLNHDIVPLSLASSVCKAALRDFHATGKGITPYVELQAGMPITLAGMHWDMDRVWASVGRIEWTKDTTHCRISVGIKVKNARLISKEAFGHHAVMAYGDHTKALERLAELLDVKYVPL